MAKNKILVIVALILVLMLFFIPLLLKDKELEYGSQKKDSSYNLENVQLMGLKDGERQWILQVDKVIDQGKNKTILNGLEHGELYKDGEAKYFLVADHGEYNRRTEDFKLVSNVQLTTTDGESIVTDELQYNHLKKEMIGDRVRVETESSTLQAQKMTVDVDEEIYDFVGSVQMELTIDDESQEEDGGGGDEK